MSIAEQGKTKGNSQNIQFNKATILRVVQLLDNVFDSIREKVNAEIDSKENSASSEDSEESEEEVKTVSKKTQPKTAPQIVRAKRPAPNTQSTAVVAPPKIRSASKKAAAKIKEEADDGESGDEGSIAEGDESDEEGEKPKKKHQIGKKRAAPF